MSFPECPTPPAATPAQKSSPPRFDRTVTAQETADFSHFPDSPEGKWCRRGLERHPLRPGKLPFPECHYQAIPSSIPWDLLSMWFESLFASWPGVRSMIRNARDGFHRPHSVRNKPTNFGQGLRVRAQEIAGMCRRLSRAEIQIISCRFESTGLSQRARPHQLLQIARCGCS